MREIKFRAWDKETKIMRAPDGSWSDFGDLDEDWFYAVKTPHPDNCEMMQYTGLKDKNGVEIYEGDILRLPEAVAGRSPYNHRIIKWHDTHAQFTMFYMDGSEQKSGYLYMDTNALQFEVVGNIYSNPKLLRTSIEKAPPNSDGALSRSDD